MSAGPVAGSVSAGPAAHSSQAADRARAVRIRMVAVRDQFTACEQRIERASGRVPAMAIVGASYTAGVGPDNPALSWAADLARNLRWDAVIDGVSGAGYVRTGTDGLGPMTRLLSAEQLPGLSPSLVIVQAGYDDGLVPAGLEQQQVLRTIELIRAEAPHARIGLVTVFTSPARPIPARFFRTDAAIVAAAQGGRPERDHHGPAHRAVEVPARRRPPAPDRGGRRLDRAEGRRDPARARHRQRPGHGSGGRPDHLRRRRPASAPGSDARA